MAAALLDPWILRGGVVTFGLECREAVAGAYSAVDALLDPWILRGRLLVPRAAKPWRGRTLEGSGGSGTRFWTRGFCLEGSSLLASRAAKPWRGRALEGSGGSGALLGSWILRGRVVTGGAVARAYSRGLWR